MNTPPPELARKGRGAISNRAGRFEPHQREAVDDGWPLDAGDPPPPPTTVSVDRSRGIIARNTSPDVPFDRSINPYRGCEHGCIYCFARPTHAFLGLSPGLDFETRLFYKPDAARLLEDALRDPKYTCSAMAMGTNTDPYQPIEKEYRVTRSVLEVLDRFHHPVSIVTKSALVARDIDILGRMAARGLARVCVSVTTLDRALARTLEPRAPTPARRLQTLRRLSEAGIPTGVMAAPMIPGLTDSELEEILSAAREAGADIASYTLLRLPLEIADLFAEWLRTHQPARAARVFSLIRQSRGGKIYDASFGRRMRGAGPLADLLRKRFDVACRRLGFDGERPRLDTASFRRPPRRGDQMDLF